MVTKTEGRRFLGRKYSEGSVAILYHQKVVVVYVVIY